MANNKRARSNTDVFYENDDYRRGFAEGEEIGYNNAIQFFTNTTRKNTDSAELEEVLNRNVQLREENQKLNEAQISLQTEFKERTKDFNRKLETYRIDIDKLHKQLSDTIEHYDSKKQSDRKKISQLEVDITKKKQQLDQQQNQLGQFNIQFTQLQTSNAEQVRAAAENERLQQELQNQIQSQLQQLQTSQAAQAQAATENEKQFTKLQQDAAENEGRLLQEYTKKIADITQTYSNTNSQLEGYLTNKTKQLQELQLSQAAQAQAVAEKDKLLTELQTSNEALQQLRNSNATQAQKLQNSNAALQQLQYNYDAQEQTLQSSNASHAQRLQVFQAAQAQAAAENKLRLEQLQTSYESQVQTAAAEKDKLLEQLKTSNAVQAQAAAENERLKQEHKKQLADITHTYRTEIELANQTNSKLTADNDEQIRIINESNERKYQQLQHKYDAQKKKLQSSNLELQQLQVSQAAQTKAVAEKDELLTQLQISNAAQVEQLYTDYSNEIQLANQTNSQLTADNDEQIRFIDKLNFQITDNQQQYKLLSDFNITQSQTIDNLKNQLNETEHYRQLLFNQLQANNEECLRLLEEKDIDHKHQLQLINESNSLSIAQLKIQLDASEQKVAATEATLAASKTELAENKAAGDAALKASKAALKASETELAKNKAANDAALKASEAALAKIKKENEAALAKTKAANDAALKANDAALAKIKKELADGETELAKIKKKLADNETELTESKLALRAAEAELANNKSESKTAMASIKAALEASEIKAIEANRKVENIEKALAKNKTESEAELAKSNQALADSKAELAKSNQALADSKAKTVEIELALEESKENAAQSLKKITELERINVSVNAEKEALSEKIESLQNTLKDTQQNLNDQILMNNFNIEESDEKEKNLREELTKCLLEKQQCLDEKQKLQDNVKNLEEITAEAYDFFNQAKKEKKIAELNLKEAEQYKREASLNLQKAEDDTVKALQKAKYDASEILKIADAARDETIEAANSKATAIVTDATNAATSKITEATKIAEKQLEESKNEAQIMAKSIEESIANAQQKISDAKKKSEKEIKEAEIFSEEVLQKRASEILNNANKEAQSIVDVNKDLKEENEKLSQSNSQINETLTALTTKKTELDDTLAKIKPEVEKYREEQRNIKDLSNNIKFLTRQSYEISAQIERKNDDLTKVNNNYNSKNTEYINLKSEIKQANEKFEGINTEVSFLTSNLNSKKSELASIEKKIKEKEKVEKQLKDFTQDLIETNNSFTESKQKLNDFLISEEFKNYETNLVQVNKLKNDITALNENFDDLNKKLDGKNEEIGNLDKEKTELKNNIKENKQSLSTLNETLDKTKAKLETVQTDLIDAYQLKNNLSEENEELQKKLDARNLSAEQAIAEIKENAERDIAEMKSNAAQTIAEMQEKAARENENILLLFKTEKEKAETDLKTLNDKKVSKSEEINKASIEIADKVNAANDEIAAKKKAANDKIAAKKEEADNEIKKLKKDFDNEQIALEQEKKELQNKKIGIDAVINKKNEFENEIKRLQTEIESETENEKQLKESIISLKKKKKKYDEAKYLTENEFELDFRTKIATFPLQVMQLTEENRKYQADNIILTQKLQKLLKIKEFVESFNTENDIQNFSDNLNKLKSEFDLFSIENPEVVRQPHEYSNDIESYINSIQLPYFNRLETRPSYSFNYLLRELRKQFEKFEQFVTNITAPRYTPDLQIVWENFQYYYKELFILQNQIKEALLIDIITTSGKNIGKEIIDLLKKYEQNHTTVKNCLLKLKKIEDNVDTLYKTIVGDNRFVLLIGDSEYRDNPDNKVITLEHINTFFKTLFSEIKNNPKIFENVRKKSNTKLTLQTLVQNYKILVEFKNNNDQVTATLKSEHDEALKALKKENEKKIIEDEQKITELKKENEELLTENTKINKSFDDNYNNIETELSKLRSIVTEPSILNLITNLLPQFSNDKKKYVEEIPGILEKVNQIIQTYKKNIVDLDTENNQNKENISSYTKKNTELADNISKYNEIIERNYSNIETTLNNIPQYLLQKDNDLLTTLSNLLGNRPTIISLATNLTQDTFIDTISKILPLIEEILKKNKENIEENDAKIKQVEEENSNLNLTKLTQIEKITTLLKKKEKLNDKLTEIEETLTKNNTLLDTTKLNVINLSENNQALSTQNQNYLTVIVENARLLFKENKKINETDKNSIDETKLSNEDAVNYLKKIFNKLKNSITQLIEDKKELQTKYEKAKIAEEAAKSWGDRINDTMATFTTSKKKEEQSKTDKIYDLVKTLVVSNAIHGGNSYDINSKLSIYNNSRDLDTLIQILEFLTKNTVLYQTELLNKLKIASRPIDSKNYTKLNNQLKIKDEKFEVVMDWLEKGEIDKNLMIIEQKIHDYEGFIEEICMIRENANIYGDVGNLAITNNTYIHDFLNYLIGNIKNWLVEKIDYQNDKENFLEKENKKKKIILEYLINQYSITQSLKKIVETSGLTDNEKKKYNDEYIKYIPESNYEILQKKLDKKISKTNSWKSKDKAELKKKTEETLKLKTELLEKEEKEKNLKQTIQKKKKKNDIYISKIAEKENTILQQTNEIKILAEQIKENIKKKPEEYKPEEYNNLTSTITLKNAEILANEDQKIKEKKEMQEKYNKLEEENSKLKENIKSNEQNVIKCTENLQKKEEELQKKIKENSELQLKLTNAGSVGTPVGNPVAPGSTPVGTGSYGTQIQEIEKILQIQQQQYADTSNEIQFSIRTFQELMLEKEYEAEQQKRRESIKILKGSTLKKITESITKPKKDAKQETRNLSKALAMLGKATSELSDSNRKTKEALAKRKTATSMR